MWLFVQAWAWQWPCGLGAVSQSCSFLKHGSLPSHGNAWIYFYCFVFLFILKFIIWIHSYKSCRPPGPFPCPPGFLEGSASQYGWDLIPRSSRSSMIFLGQHDCFYILIWMGQTAAFVLDCFLFVKQFQSGCLWFWHLPLSVWWIYQTSLIICKSHFDQWQVLPKLPSPWLPKEYSQLPLDWAMLLLNTNVCRFFFWRRNQWALSCRYSVNDRSALFLLLERLLCEI